MRVLAIDYGRARIGLAITDPNKTIAYPYKTVKTGSSLEKSVLIFLESIKEHINEIETIIIGFPILLSGKISEMALEVQKFVEILKSKTNIPIKFTDERLSSVMAERHLKENIGLNRKKRSKIIDPISAALLLQNFISVY
jgi:putative holliday junction resolvase